MNREQRRRDLSRKGITGAPMKNFTISTEYMHDGKNVIMQFSNDIHNFILTEAQVDEMCTALQKTKQALIAHKAAAARQGGPGHG